MVFRRAKVSFRCVKTRSRCIGEGVKIATRGTLLERGFRPRSVRGSLDTKVVLSAQAIPSKADILGIHSFLFAIIAATRLPQASIAALRSASSSLR